MSSLLYSSRRSGAYSRLRREHFTIVRRGRPVAELGPAASGSGHEIKSLLRRHPVDAGWSTELGEARPLLHVEERH